MKVLYEDLYVGNQYQMHVLSAVLIPYASYVAQVNSFKCAKELRMSKTEVEVRFTLPLDGTLLEHKADAERKVLQAFVLELLRHGDISTGRAARLLNISLWDLSELMYEAGISPFDDSLVAETLDAEVKSALKDFDESIL